MGKKKYSKEFRTRVALEAFRPESEGLEHIIASKYQLRVNTVLKWKMIYQQYGMAGFGRRNASVKVMSEREKELEKENAALREEVAILKKAAAFLADLRRE